MIFERKEVPYKRKHGQQIVYCDIANTTVIQKKVNGEKMSHCLFDLPCSKKCMANNKQKWTSLPWAGERASQQKNRDKREEEGDNYVWSNKSAFDVWHANEPQRREELVTSMLSRFGHVSHYTDNVKDSCYQTKITKEKRQFQETEVFFSLSLSQADASILDAVSF